MKKAVVLFAALAGIMQAQAQTQSTPDPQRMKANRLFITKMLAGQLPNTGRKPTGTAHRVKAQAAQETGGTVDSTLYVYSGTRGSRYNYDNRDWGYNTYFTSYYAPLPLFPLVLNPLDVQADSIKLYENDTINDIETATYRPDNKIINNTSIYPDPMGDYYYREANGYNSQGYLTTTYIVEGDPAALDTTGKRTVTYNSAFTQIVTDSTFTKNGSNYDLVAINKYYYNSGNRLDSAKTYSINNGPLLLGQTARFDYYTDNKLRKFVTDSYNDTGAVIFNSVDTFGYTTGVAYTTLWDTYIHSDFTPDTYGERWLKFPGSNGNPDSSIRYGLNSGNWEEYDRIYYSYTSFNAPQKLTFFGGGAEFGQYRFYYEDYEDGTSGIDPLAKNKNFSLYPNPFHNNLYIDWKGQQGNVSVSLYNIIGQEVYNNTLSLRNGKNTLDIPGLNAGNYILLLRDTDGKTWSSKVVKQ